MDRKVDFKKLAAEAFRPENIAIIDIPKVRATLFQGDRLVATGQAEVSDDGVTFFPQKEECLDTRLHEPISLKVSGSEDAIRLSHPQELFELGNRMIWFFEKAQ